MKAEISQKAFLGMGAAAIVVVVGLAVYFFRASDPASSAPIPYKKFDYGAHMQQQMGQLNRQGPQPTGSSQAPVTP